MKRSNKKGFTTVELVIVIAVIAILAAVLIPTFANLIEKANMSADQQAVRQMNTALAMDEVMRPTDIIGVHEVLSDLGMSAKDYTPLTKDTYFYWDANENRVLHVDKTKTVLYPKEYEGKVYDATKDIWFALNMRTMSTEAPEGYTEASKAVTVATAEELAYVVDTVNEMIASGKTDIDLTIDLGGGVIDMMGAGLNIGALSSNNGKQTFTIKNGTIKNVSSVDTSKFGDGKTEGHDGQYGTAGLIVSISGYMNVVLEDLVIENINVKNTHAGNVGILVGKNSGNLTIKNVKVNNSSVIGHRNTGALVGYNTKNLTIENVDLTNVDVKTVGGRSALLVGYQNGKGKIVSASGIDLANCSYTLYECDQNTGTSPEGNELGLQAGGAVWSWCYDGTEKEDYNTDKYFVENALIMVPGEGKQVSANDQFGTVTGWN